MRYKPSIAKLKGKKHQVRGSGTHFTNCQDCTQEERQKARRSEKWV